MKSNLKKGHLMKRNLAVVAPVLTVFLFLSSGCAVLTGSQIKNINAFAGTAKNYSEYTSVVVQKRAELHLHDGLLEASGFKVADKIEVRVTEARNEYDTATLFNARFDLSIRLIQEYAGLLAKLSSDQFAADLAAPARSIGDHLDSLIVQYNSKAVTALPVTIGDAVAKVVLLAGQRLIRRRQTIALKQFILLADTLVQATTKNLVAVLGDNAGGPGSEEFRTARGDRFATLKTLLAVQRKSFVDDYHAVVFLNVPKIDYASVKFYSDELDDYDNVELCRAKIVMAATKLAAAHRALAKNVLEKRDLMELATETQSLVTDCQSIAGTGSSLFKK